MRLTAQDRKRLRQSADAGCAILSVQDCIGALDTMDLLEAEARAIIERAAQHMLLLDHFIIRCSCGERFKGASITARQWEQHILALRTPPQGAALKLVVALAVEKAFFAAREKIIAGYTGDATINFERAYLEAQAAVTQARAEVEGGT
jgi:hypothetical protein